MTGTASDERLPRQPGPRSTPTKRHRLFGMMVDSITMDEAVQRCLDAASSRQLLEVGVINAAKVVNMRRDPELREAVSGCDLVVADGQSVVWASRILGAPLPERVAGIDLFQRLLVEAEKRGLAVYFLGAREHVLAAMVERIRAALPKLRIAGSRDGYFSDDEAIDIADEIAACGTDLLFLGMTSPKKEVFVAEHGKRTGASVVHGVGGSFDVLAGVVRRAPAAWQRLGLEWLYRAVQEPRRLGKRYVTTNAAFVAFVARERLRRPHRATETS